MHKISLPPIARIYNHYNRRVNPCMHDKSQQRTFQINLRVPSANWIDFRYECSRQYYYGVKRPVNLCLSKYANLTNRKLSATHACELLLKKAWIWWVFLTADGPYKGVIFALVAYKMSSSRNEVRSPLGRLTTRKFIFLFYWNQNCRNHRLHLNSAKVMDLLNAVIGYHAGKKLQNHFGGLSISDCSPTGVKRNSGGILNGSPTTGWKQLSPVEGYSQHNTQF